MMLPRILSWCVPNYDSGPEAQDWIIGGLMWFILYFLLPAVIVLAIFGWTI
jgi:hypothetical protein